MNFGEKNKEKKHEFPMPIPVTPVKIPAAAGRAHEESSKTVGPAGDSLDKRGENKVMDDIETSSTSSEKGEELSIMEEGEYSDDDDMNDLSSANDKNLKENDTNKDRVTVTEVVDITKISSNKLEQYTATPSRILKLVQINKGQKTRFMLNIEGGGDLKLVETQLTMFQILFYLNL